MKDAIILESWRFTSLSAFGRELTHLLENSNYKIEAHVRHDEIERVISELGMLRGIGRLRVKIKLEAQECEGRTDETS